MKLVCCSEKSGMESIPEPVKPSRNSTYTITNPKKSSSSVKVFTADKNKNKVCCNVN